MKMIRLEPFERADFGQLIHWIDSPEFMIQWSGKVFHFPLTEEQLENYIAGNGLKFRVVHEASGSVIGHISLGVDEDNNSGRIGKVIIGEQAWHGQGVGRLMIRKVLEIAFEQLNLHRVTLGVFDFNHSAIACYEKAGFVKEGLFRESRKVGDAYWNLIEMGILAKEWPISE